MDLHGTKIRHLVALVAVDRERSFRAAARRLGCAQSVLSRHVAEFEEALGTRLVERASGNAAVGLTEAGRLMCSHADVVLARVEAARADLNALASPSPLRVGVYEAVARRVLPHVLAGPVEPTIIPREADDAALPALVARGDVDIAFATLPLPEGPFGSIDLLTEPYVLLVPATSELVRRSRAPALAELAALPLLAPGSSAAAETVAVQLAARGAQPDFVLRPGSDASVHALVGTGVGVAIVPALSVDPEDPKSVAIDLGGLLPSRTVVLVWHRYRRQPEEAVRFRMAAVRACAEIARTGLRAR